MKSGMPSTKRWKPLVSSSVAFQHRTKVSSVKKRDDEHETISALRDTDLEPRQFIPTVLPLLELEYRCVLPSSAALVIDLAACLANPKTEAKAKPLFTELLDRWKRQRAAWQALSSHTEASPLPVQVDRKLNSLAFVPDLRTLTSAYFPSQPEILSTVPTSKPLFSDF